MCIQSQPYSPVEHALIAGCGHQWQERILVMFNVYIDDSGTAPDQRIVIASALIMPAKQILALESNWKGFKDKYGIGPKGFHASEFAHRNPKNDSASWDERELENAFQRVQQLTIKYSTRAISYALTKTDYNEVVPEKWRNFTGNNHYVWVVRHVLRIIEMWSEGFEWRSNLEYIFDFEAGPTKSAIDQAMSQLELLKPGCYEGRYSFRKRPEWAGLQCADLFAWACLGGARLTFENTPIHPLAESTLRAYRKQPNNWMIAGANSREDLRKSVEKHLALVS